MKAKTKQDALTDLTVKLFVQNLKEIEEELKRINDAVQWLLGTRVLRIPQDVELENLLDRVSEYITNKIKVGVRV